MKILKWIGIIVGSLVLLLTTTLTYFSLTTQSEFNDSLSEKYPATPDQIWNILTDIEGIPARRPEVLSIEITEKNPAHPTKWKEQMDMGGYIYFEVLEWEKPRILKLQMQLDEGIFKMSGMYTYSLSRSGNHTTVNISEHSYLESFFAKAMYGIAGRDALLKEEHRILRDALSRKEFDK